MRAQFPADRKPPGGRLTAAPAPGRCVVWWRARVAAPLEPVLPI
jgi:hypothetical protein